MIVAVVIIIVIINWSGIFIQLCCTGPGVVIVFVPYILCVVLCI